MKKRRWGLLIGVPLLLLAMALAINSRRSRPATPTDARLWDLGEAGTALTLSYQSSEQLEAQGVTAGIPPWVEITDKRGIREIMRSFRNVGPLHRAPDTPFNLPTQPGAVAQLHPRFPITEKYWTFYLNRPGALVLALSLIKIGGQDTLYFGDLHQEALVPAATGQRLRAAIARARQRAKQGEKGYRGIGFITRTPRCPRVCALGVSSLNVSALGI